MTAVAIHKSAHAIPAADKEWYQHGSKASYLRSKGMLKESLREYKLALAAASHLPASQKGALLDLKLGAVAAMTLNGDFAEAEQQMLEIQKGDLNQYKGELLEARFWRRLSELRAAKGEYASAADAREKASDIILAQFGKDSPNYAEELQLLLHRRMDAGQAKEAVSTMVKLGEMAKSKIPEADASRYRLWIQACMDNLVSSLRNQIDKARSAEQAQDLALILQDAFTISGPDSPIWNCWQSALAKFTVISPTTARSSANFLVANINLQSASAAQVTLLAHAASGLMFDRIFKGTQNEKFDQRTEYLADTAEQALIKVLSTSELLKNRWFIQIESMKALILARRGKVADADRLCDSIIPDASIVETQDDLNGVFQARHDGIVPELAKKRDIEGIKKQYAKLVALLPRMTKLKDRAALQSVWILTQQKTLKKIQP